MEYIFAWIPLAFIAVTILNAFLLWQRVQRHIAENPERERGYRASVRGFLVLGNIPWVIMLAGNATGLTSTVFDYFQPAALNPVVLLWHGSLIALWILFARWVFLGNGTEFLVQHPGLLVRRMPGQYASPTPPWLIRLYAGLMLGGSLLSTCIMWVMFPGKG